MQNQKIKSNNYKLISDTINLRFVKSAANTVKLQGEFCFESSFSAFILTRLLVVSWSQRHRWVQRLYLYLDAVVNSSTQIGNVKFGVIETRNGITKSSHWAQIHPVSGV
jgi:hypothetical protein